MGTPRLLKYFNRALLKPNTLDVFEGFDSGFDRKGRAKGYTQAWHRVPWDCSPYAVVNEIICGEIGRFLRLPIPPFAITYMTSPEGKRMPVFSSLDFSFNRDRMPAILPGPCVQRLPELCAGVLVFDILIANEDRHDQNIVVDNVLKPKEMHVYDHDQALLGGYDPTGEARLDKLQDRLGITGGPITGGNEQVFLKHVTSYAHVEAWAKRVREIPVWFIDSVCAEAAHYGLTKKLAKRTAFFLREQSGKILDLIDANRQSFVIGDWPLQRRLGFL